MPPPLYSGLRIISLVIGGGLDQGWRLQISNEISGSDTESLREMLPLVGFQPFKNISFWCCSSWHSETMNWCFCVPVNNCQTSEWKWIYSNGKIELDFAHPLAENFAYATDECWAFDVPEVREWP